MKTKINIVSLFSGCGGLDLGFSQANRILDNPVSYEIVWANDLFEAAYETYRSNIGHHIVCKDIRSISTASIPDCDLILGGFPCQDFSVSWTQRKGTKSERGNLYLEFCRVVQDKQPLVFIAENVKGLLSVNKGKDFKKIKEDFAALGYDLHWWVYNFADYGVPQIRERVILIGVREDFDRTVSQVPPTHTGNHIGAKKALQGVESVADNNEFLNIRANTIERLMQIPPGGNYLDIPEESPLYVQGRRSHVYRRLHPDKPSFTIIARGGGGTWGYHFEEPRALTNRERARLQGFPDDFVFKGSIQEVREQIGNAVPPVFAQKLALHLAPLMQSLKAEQQSELNDAIYKQVAR